MRLLLFIVISNFKFRLRPQSQVALGPSWKLGAVEGHRPTKTSSEIHMHSHRNQNSGKSLGNRLPPRA